MDPLSKGPIDNRIPTDPNRVRTEYGAWLSAASKKRSILLHSVRPMPADGILMPYSTIRTRVFRPLEHELKPKAIPTKSKDCD